MKIISPKKIEGIKILSSSLMSFREQEILSSSLMSFREQTNEGPSSLLKYFLISSAQDYYINLAFSRKLLTFDVSKLEKIKEEDNSKDSDVE